MLSLILFSLILFLPNFIQSTEDCIASRRLPPKLVVEQFQQLSEKKFIGQENAYDTTLSGLRKFQIRKDLVLLHYVGSSGTGKTYLANLVSKSFFKWPISTEHILTENTDSFCGYAYADFLSVDQEDEKISETLLRSTFERAFLGYDNNKAEPTIIIVLDNFNKCRNSCETLFTKTVTSKRFRLLNKEVSIKNCIILITSDLGEEGLLLLPGEDREKAVERVLSVSRETWGEDSLFNDVAHVIPFAPYSDYDLIRIFELQILDVQEEIRKNLEDAFKYRSGQISVAFVKLKWTGRFLFSDLDKTKVLDVLHHEIRQKNLRAFEKIKAKLIGATRRPELIETRLLEYRPIIFESDYVPKIAQKFASTIFSYFKREIKFETHEYTQNLVFKAVNDHRLVHLEIDDVDGGGRFENLNEESCV